LRRQSLPGLPKVSWPGRRGGRGVEDDARRWADKRQVVLYGGSKPTSKGQVDFACRRGRAQLGRVQPLVGSDDRERR